MMSETGNNLDRRAALVLGYELWTPTMWKGQGPPISMTPVKEWRPTQNIAQAWLLVDEIDRKSGFYSIDGANGEGTVYAMVSWRDSGSAYNRFRFGGEVGCAEAVTRACVEALEALG